jgi:hypothetical protein
VRHPCSETCTNNRRLIEQWTRKNSNPLCFRSMGLHSPHPPSPTPHHTSANKSSLMEHCGGTARAGGVSPCGRPGTRGTPDRPCRPQTTAHCPGPQWAAPSPGPHLVPSQSLFVGSSPIFPDQHTYNNNGAGLANRPLFSTKREALNQTIPRNHLILGRYLVLGSRLWTLLDKSPSSGGVCRMIVCVCVCVCVSGCERNVIIHSGMGWCRVCGRLRVRLHGSSGLQLQAAGHLLDFLFSP